MRRCECGAYLPLRPIARSILVGKVNVTGPFASIKSRKEVKRSREKKEAKGKYLNEGKFSKVGGARGRQRLFGCLVVYTSLFRSVNNIYNVDIIQIRAGNIRSDLSRNIGIIHVRIIHEIFVCLFNSPGTCPFPFLECLSVISGDCVASSGFHTLHRPPYNTHVHS